MIKKLLSRFSSKVNMEDAPKIKPRKDRLAKLYLEEYAGKYGLILNEFFNAEIGSHKWILSRESIRPKLYGWNLGIMEKLNLSPLEKVESSNNVLVYIEITMNLRGLFGVCFNLMEIK